MSGLCLLMVNTSQSPSQHCSCWLHSRILSATFATSSSLPFLASHSLWPCLECAVSWSVLGALPDRLLLDRLVLLRFTRSLVLSVASCNVKSFTARSREDLLRSASSTKDTTLRSMSRRPWPAGCFHGIIHCSSSLCRLAVLVDTRLAYFVNLLFLLNTQLPRAAGGLLVHQLRSPTLRALRV